MSTYISFKTAAGDDILIDASGSDSDPASLEPSRAGLGDVTQVLVKVSDAGFESAISTITKIMRAFANEFASVPEHPEVELAFALEANAELGCFAVGKISGKSTFQVKVKWTSIEVAQPVHG